MNPALIIVPAVLGVGAIALRARAVAKAKTGAIAPADAAASSAALKQSIAQGLQNGTVRLSASGVPFQTVSPPATAQQIVSGLTKPDGTLDILPGDLIAVDASTLAGTLVAGAANLPGFGINENVIMLVKGLNDPRNGPVSATSEDPKLVLAGPVNVPVNAIRGVQPADAAQLEKDVAASVT